MSPEEVRKVLPVIRRNSRLISDNRFVGGEDAGVYSIGRGTRRETSRSSVVPVGVCAMPVKLGCLTGVTMQTPPQTYVASKLPKSCWSIPNVLLKP